MSNLIKSAFILATGITLSCAPYLARSQSILQLTGPANLGGATYLVAENCEGPSTPPGWANTGTVNWDAVSPTLPQGGESLNINRTTGNHWSQVQYTPDVDRWGYFQFHMTSFSTGAQLFQVDSSTNARLGWARVEFGNKIRVSAEGGSNVDTVATVATGTDYHLWWHYKQGGGTDAIFEIWFSTDGNKPADSSSGHAKSGNGTSTTQAARFSARVTLANMNVNYDRLLVSASVIGNNP